MRADRSPLSEAALDLQQFCEERGWRFCFIGGIANARWGIPRFTEDADLSLLTGFGGEEAYIEPLLDRFEARRPDARDFALRSRVVLLRHENGVALDVGLAAFPYEEATIERATYCELPGGLGRLRICSAEDFIIYKAFAGREHDWADIEGVLERQRRLNLSIVRQELPWLLEAKEDDGRSLERLEALCQRHGHTL
ncbi:MAG: hypothetical protein NZ533_10600 [Casimicrobiaceae bacterium]|nr:hypothetical protein [Casimicrobiaceae bacterium]MDW8311926.1 hypothetical protein [Burkholderiales bacterium]